MRTVSRIETRIRRQNGLTLLEIIFITFVVFLIASLLLPALSGSTKSPRIKCINNIKQIALGSIDYALDNHDQFPPVPEGPNHLPWDIPWGPSVIMEMSGLTRDIWYDPLFPQQNTDRLWNAASNKFRIVGYAMTYAGANSTLQTSNQIRVISTNDLQAPAAAQRVVVADPIISLSGQDDPRKTADYQWRNIPGGLPTGTKTPLGKWKGFRTSHLTKNEKLPLGGNVGFMDGHAKWFPWSNQIPRTTGINSTPLFWW